MKNINTNELKGCDYTPVFLEDAEAQEAPTRYAEGFAYEINDGDGTCTVTGIDTLECEKLNIPPVIEGFKVTGIGDDAFANYRHYRRLQSIIVPDSVTWIGDNAFWGCSSLKNVIIGNGVAWIGDSAFAYCGALKSVTIPAEAVRNMGDNVFLGCEALESVAITDSSVTPPTGTGKRFINIPADAPFLKIKIKH